MKKISIFAFFAVVSMPAFATEMVDQELSLAEQAAQTTNEEYPEVKTSETSSLLHGVQLGVGVSATGGLNGFVGYANKDFDSFWAKRFGVRFDFAMTKPVKSLIDKGIDSVIGDDGVDVGDSLTITDGKIDAQHFAALVDFYPFGNTWFLGGWRITGGYAFGNMDMSANIAGTFDGPSGRYEFELAGQKYAYTGNSVQGTADLDWKYRGPYLGTGFDIGLFAGLKIYVDAGVVFTNKSAELSLDVPTTNLQQFDGTTWVAADVPELEVVKEKVLADAQSDLNDLKFYPMVKLGFMYRF